MTLDTSLRQLTYAIVSIIGFGWLMYIGKGLLLPFIFAVLLAILIYPIDKRVNQFIKINWLSIVVTFLLVLIPILILGALLSLQLFDIVDSLPSIADSLKQGASRLETYVHDLFPFLSLPSNQMISDPVHIILDNSVAYLSQGLVSTTTLIANFFLTFIYMFFILYYRKSFKNFIIYQFKNTNRSDINQMIENVKTTIQSYLGGLILVILLLSVLNSLGLKLIGIDYPLFWGVLAGLLAIIPYIGTALGGLLPLLFALSTSDNLWQPIAIVVFYSFVQFLEGNIITPKIVGDKININPLFAIFSLIFFGSFWGIGGVVLALPLISIIRIVLSQFKSTASLAVLMSSDIADSEQRFEQLSKR